MLYERWQHVARGLRGEIAVREFHSGRTWTFDQLDAESSRATHDASPVLFPSGAGAAFVLQTLAAWRRGAILCPIEPGTAPPPIPAIPPGAAHLKLTSATTGRPRLVAFTAEQLAADADQIVSTMGLRPAWPNVGAISLAHSYGFSNLVLPLLLHGIPLHLLDAPLPESLRRAVAGIGDVTVPAVPALWRAWHEAGALSPRIRLAISAGAPLPLGLEGLVFETSGLKIHNFYGATECGGIAYDRSHTPRSDDACVGTPMDGVSLTVGPSGCLEVRGLSVGTTYWPEPDAALADGCFRTSDLAEIKEHVVFLRGRAGDQINVAGRKVSPETIEREILASQEVRDCLVFGVPGADAGRGDLIVACVVPQAAPHAGGDEAALKRFLQNRLPAWQVPREWRFVESLQPNQRGKLSRAQWRARLGYP